MLKQFGISPDQLGPEKIQKLLAITDNVSNPTDITPEISRQIMDIMGIGTKGIPNKPKQVQNKVGRNEICPCGKSGKKYKKCCGVIKPI